MSVAGWLNAAWWLTCQPEAGRFEAATRRVALTQAQLIAELLRQNGQTEFGRQYGFESVQNPREYQERVPLSSYADYAGAIERVARGDQNVLTAEPVLLLEPTSGTTSGEKLIPYTASLRREFQRGVAAWVADLFSRRPGAACGRAYWSISPASRKPKRTSAGPPIGFDDDAAYLSGWQQLFVRGVLAVPGDIARVGDRDAFRYITLLYLLAARNLSLISIWSPTFLPALLAPLPAWHNQLCRDLRHGTCNPPPWAADDLPQRLTLPRPLPRRADEVSAIVSSTTELSEICGQLWPNLALISTWADAAAHWFVPELRRLFPAAELQPKGLLATEGCITIPLVGEAAPALAVRSHFFEFQPCNRAGAASGDECSLAHELCLGAKYRVVITTGGGLYRYQLGDLVEVAGFKNGAPLLRLLGKGDQVCDLVGEKLAEPFVQAMLTDLFAERRFTPQFSLLAPAIDQPPHYRLYVQPTTRFHSETGEMLGALLEKRLESNPHYRDAVQLGQLAPVEVFWLRPDGPPAWEIFQQVRLQQGQKAGAIKAVALDPWPQWHTVFDSFKVASEEVRT